MSVLYTNMSLANHYSIGIYLYAKMVLNNLLLIPIVFTQFFSSRPGKISSSSEDLKGPKIFIAQLILLKVGIIPFLKSRLFMFVVCLYGK